MWNGRMSQDNLIPIFDNLVAEVLESQGLDYKHSFSPRSIYKVDKLFQQLEGFDPSASVRVDVQNVHVSRGIAFAYLCFAKGSNVQNLTQWDIARRDIVSNWQASAGLTAMGMNKERAYPRAIRSAFQILEGSRRPEPCLALTRTSKNDKTRLVWGYPFSMTLIEGSFAKPLLEKLKLTDTPMAFAMSNAVMGAKIVSATNQNNFWYSLDASQFDATIQRDMIAVAFRIIRTWFDLDAQFHPDLDVTNGDVLRLIENYFIHTPIVMPNTKGGRAQGVLHIGKRHGVPSGSFFTQLVDSIVNIIVAGTLASRFGFKLNPASTLVLGDDLLFFANKRLELEELAKFASDTFAMKFNSTKSKMGHVSDWIPFLGRIWRWGVPERTVDEAIDRMLWPESFRSYQNRDVEPLLVVMSYALSAISDPRLLPNRVGWEMQFANNELRSVNRYLSGYQRYRETYGPHSNNNPDYRKVSALKVLK